MDVYVWSMSLDHSMTSRMQVPQHRGNFLLSALPNYRSSWLISWFVTSGYSMIFVALCAQTGPVLVYYYLLLYYLLHTDVPICNVNSFDVYSLLDKHLLILQQRLRMGRQLHGQCGGQLSLVCHHERAPKACHLEMVFNPWSWTSNAWGKHPQSLHEMGFSKWIWHHLRCSVLDVKTWELEPARWLMIMNELVDKRKWYHDPSLSLHFD